MHGRKLFFVPCAEQNIMYLRESIGSFLVLFSLFAGTPMLFMFCEVKGCWALIELPPTAPKLSPEAILPEAI